MNDYSHSATDPFSNELVGSGQRANAQFTQVEISIKCRELKKTDWLSNTDPFCVLSISEPATNAVTQDSASEVKVSKLPSGRSTELGRTEVVRDNQNPDFCKTFNVAFVFEEQQIMTLRVFDEDKRGSTNLKKHTFLGSGTVSLGELMNAPGRSLKISLRKKGYAIIHAEEVASCNDEFVFQLAGSKLKNSDGMFGKSDPYYTISKQQEDGEFCHVFRSEVVHDNLFPEWMSQQLPLQKLCNGDLDRPLKIEIWDYDRNRAHEKIGIVDTTLRNLSAVEKLDVLCDGVPFGHLIVREAKINEIPSFLDYLSGSCRMRFTAAVDFSLSNGHLRSRDSLHFIDHRGFPNEYEAAIGSVGSILEDYCLEKHCFLLGYGMKGAEGSTRMHTFPVGDSSGVTGVNGMLNAYRDHIERTEYEMCEPTILAPMIRNAGKAALQRSELNEQEYSILLIISDGGIHDFQQTVDEICVAAETPMSIVIVGVGDGDFSSMEKLDSDDAVLVSSNGMKCPRDIVQFVPFRKCSQNVSRLAAETLAEIPRQLVQYFSSKGILPTPQASAVPESGIEWGDSASAALPSSSEVNLPRAEASPMMIVDSLPLIEVTAVEAVEGPVRPSTESSAVAAAAAAISSPRTCQTKQVALPETHVEHHGPVSSSMMSKFGTSPCSQSATTSSASTPASWVAQKQGHRLASGPVPGTAVFTQNESAAPSWVDKKQGRKHAAK